MEHDFTHLTIDRALIIHHDKAKYHHQKSSHLHKRVDLSINKQENQTGKALMWQRKPKRSKYVYKPISSTGKGDTP